MLVFNSRIAKCLTWLVSLIFCFFCLPAFAYNEVTGATDTTKPYDEAKLAWVASQFKPSLAPEKIAYKKAVSAALASKVPVLAVKNLIDPRADLAQRLLLADPRLLKGLFDPKTEKPLRSEVMSVKPALPGDRVGVDNACWEGGCFRVDIYNFFYNATLTALVDTTNKKVISFNSTAEAQPDLSPRLRDLAIAIAKSEPAVQLEVGRYLKFIGQKQKAQDVLPVMADTKSALRDTLCERSKHLCVSPTYVLGDKALWVIVDLTDMKVVGLRWTTVGDSGPDTIITERKVENEYVFKNFCEEVNEVNRDGWRFDYHITTSDGLRLAKTTFNNKPVFESAKVVDWHVSYSKKDEFGYSDATGCPMFSSAVVVAFEGPRIEPIIESGKEVGFYISQDFRQQSWPSPCNYRYEERYEFYKDGRYRVVMASHGRGCGEGGTYRPVLRISLGGAPDGAPYQLEHWAEGWQKVTNESFVQPADAKNMAQQQYSHRIVSKAGHGYKVAPNAGQHNDGSRGDNAFVYVTVNHAEKDEGERDLVTLGTCCNSDYRQGPELFMQPVEQLDKQKIVFWYVPQLKNDGRAGKEYCWAENKVVDGVLTTQTWPCAGGPMFTPIANKEI